MGKSKMEQNNDTTASMSQEVISAIKKIKGKKPEVAACKIGLPPGWRRVTLIMRDEHYEKLKEMSQNEEVTIKDILFQLFERFFKSQKNNP